MLTSRTYRYGVNRWNTNLNEEMIVAVVITV